MNSGMCHTRRRHISTINTLDLVNEINIKLQLNMAALSALPLKYGGRAVKRVVALKLCFLQSHKLFKVLL